MEKIGQHNRFIMNWSEFGGAREPSEEEILNLMIRKQGRKPKDKEEAKAWLATIKNHQKALGEDPYTNYLAKENEPIPNYKNKL
jgi:hypothetical protein